MIFASIGEVTCTREGVYAIIKTNSGKEETMAEPAPVPSGWRGRPVYTRVSVVGLLFFGLVLLFLAVLAAKDGDSKNLAFTLALAVPSLVVAGLVWRFGKWMLLVAAVWALALLLLDAFFLIPAFSNVNSFFDFGVAVAFLAGLLTAIVGGAVSFLQQRRGTARTVATRPERVAFSAVAAVVVGLMAMSGILQITGRTSVGADAKAGATPVIMKNTEFLPTQLSIPAGRPAIVVVKNGDLNVHTFTIEDLRVDHKLLGGSELLVELPSASAGTYEYHCTVPGHESMKGTLIVK